MRAITRLLFLSFAALFGTLAQASNITCYHVLEATCRSETTDDHIGFVALTWAIKGGSPIDKMIENCANSYDVQLDYWDYLNHGTDTVPEHCRSGYVNLETVHEYRRSEDKEKALAEYRSLARQCMEDSRFEKCATTEDLDLIQGIGITRVLLKGRTPERAGAYPPAE
jgi:hypothetical protein